MVTINIHGIKRITQTRQIYKNFEIIRLIIETKEGKKEINLFSNEQVKIEIEEDERR